MFASSGPGNLTIPGVVGTILIDVFNAVPIASGVISPSGLGSAMLGLPNAPSLVGKTAHLQALVAQGGLAVSNADQLSIE